MDAANSSDIEGVLEIGTTRIGDDHVGAAVLRARLERQPMCLAVSRDRADQVVAYTILYTLSATSTELILAGLTTKGSMLQVDDLAADHDGASIYIAAVAASPGSEIAALDLLRLHVAATLEGHANVEWLFGRAATIEGRRLLKRFDFRPLPSPSEVEVRMLDDHLRQALLVPGSRARTSLSRFARCLREGP